MNKRGHEVATIDCALITISVPNIDHELILDTASQIEVTPQIETQDAIRLIIKNILRAQKPQQNVLTGNTLVLTNNVFIPELVLILQGGTLEFDESDRIVAYEPPVAGSVEKGKIFTLNAYSAIYNAAGIVTGFEKIKYPNCQGVPIALSSQDGVFRVSSYTINSAPDMGQAPYRIEWIAPNELPVADYNPNEKPITTPEPTPIEPEIISTSPLPDGEAGEEYVHRLLATGYPAPTWQVTSGDLPTGLTMDSTGLISGLPVMAQTGTFTVEANNNVGDSDERQFMLTIYPAS